MQRCGPRHADCCAWLVGYELEIVHESSDQHESATALFVVEHGFPPVALVAHLDNDVSVIDPAANGHRMTCLAVFHSVRYRFMGRQDDRASRRDGHFMTVEPIAKRATDSSEADLLGWEGEYQRPCVRPDEDSSREEQDRLPGGYGTRQLPPNRRNAVPLGRERFLDGVCAL